MENKNVVVEVVNAIPAIPTVPAYDVTPAVVGNEANAVIVPNAIKVNLKNLNNGDMIELSMGKEIKASFKDTLAMFENTEGMEQIAGIKKEVQNLLKDAKPLIKGLNKNVESKDIRDSIKGLWLKGDYSNITLPLALREIDGWKDEVSVFKGVSIRVIKNEESFIVYGKDLYVSINEKEGSYEEMFRVPNTFSDLKLCVKNITQESKWFEPKRLELMNKAIGQLKDEKLVNPNLSISDFSQETINRTKQNMKLVVKSIDNLKKDLESYARVNGLDFTR